MSAVAYMYIPLDERLEQTIYTINEDLTAAKQKQVLYDTVFRLQKDNPEIHAKPHHVVRVKFEIVDTIYVSGRGVTHERS